MLVLHGCRLRQTVVLAHTNDENDHMHFVPCIAIRYIMYLRFVRRCVVIATRMLVDNVRLWLRHVSVHTLCIVCVRLPSCKYWLSNGIGAVFRCVAISVSAGTHARLLQKQRVGLAMF